MFVCFYWFLLQKKELQAMVAQAQTLFDIAMVAESIGCEISLTELCDEFARLSRDFRPGDVAGRGCGLRSFKRGGWPWLLGSSVAVQRF